MPVIGSCSVGLYARKNYAHKGLHYYKILGRQFRFIRMKKDLIF